MLQEWGPYKTSHDASSKRNTTILACNIHHLGEWYGAFTYLHFGLVRFAEKPWLKVLFADLL